MKFNWMIKNSKGEYDGSWTLAVLSWLVVSSCIWLSVIEKLTIGSFNMSFKVPSETLLLGYLAAMTGNYCFRRTKKDGQEAGTPDSEEKKEE